MLIDWFTVGAQALNFVVLVVLLRHFLYKPILAAIAAREKRIADELADAAAKKADAEKEHAEFDKKTQDLEAQRAALLEKATADAATERARLLEEAKKAADALSAKRAEGLRKEGRDLLQSVSRRAREEVFAIARKTLADLATTSLEERIGEVFTRRLREMEGEAKEALGAALKAGSEAAVVRSAFDVPPEQRAAIQNALNETFSASVALRYETAPEVVSGIELTARGQRVGWSIADYLAGLEKGVTELLSAAVMEPSADAKATPTATTGADAHHA